MFELTHLGSFLLKNPWLVLDDDFACRLDF